MQRIKLTIYESQEKIWKQRFIGVFQYNSVSRIIISVLLYTIIYYNPLECSLPRYFIESAGTREWERVLYLIMRFTCRVYLRNLTRIRLKRLKHTFFLSHTVKCFYNTLINVHYLNMYYNIWLTITNLVDPEHFQPLGDPDQILYRYLLTYSW